MSPDFPSGAHSQNLSWLMSSVMQVPGSSLNRCTLIHCPVSQMFIYYAYLIAWQKCIPQINSSCDSKRRILSDRVEMHEDITW